MDLRVKISADLENSPHSHAPSPTSPMKTARERVVFTSKKVFPLMTALEVTGRNGVGIREGPKFLRSLPRGTNLLRKCLRISII